MIAVTNSDGVTRFVLQNIQKLFSRHHQKEKQNENFIALNFSTVALTLFLLDCNPRKKLRGNFFNLESNEQSIKINTFKQMKRFRRPQQPPVQPIFVAHTHTRGTISFISPSCCRVHREICCGEEFQVSQYLLIYLNPWIRLCNSSISEPVTVTSLEAVTRFKIKLGHRAFWSQ